MPSGVTLCCIGASVGQSTESAPLPLISWVQFQLGTTYDNHVKRVSQRSAESRGFLPSQYSVRFPPTGNVDMQGWLGLPEKSNPSIVAMLRDGESKGGCYMRP
jgi:hypothetical protein